MSGPTVSIQTITLPDGSFGVNVLVAGLHSQQQAEAAAAYVQSLLCGSEINAQ